MPKLAIVLAATVALLFAWLIALNAEATTSGAAAIGAKAYSPIIMPPKWSFDRGQWLPPGDAPSLQEKDWMLVRSLLV